MKHAMCSHALPYDWCFAITHPWKVRITMVFGQPERERRLAAWLSRTDDQMKSCKNGPKLNIMGSIVHRSTVCIFQMGLQNSTESYVLKRDRRRR